MSFLPVSISNADSHTLPFSELRPSGTRQPVSKEQIVQKNKFHFQVIVDILTLNSVPRLSAEPRENICFGLRMYFTFDFPFFQSCFRLDQVVLSSQFIKNG